MGNRLSETVGTVIVIGAGLCTGLIALTSGLYAGISMTVMWSEAPRWGRGRAL